MAGFVLSSSPTAPEGVGSPTPEGAGMESEAGDFGPDLNGMLAQAPPAPGVRGGFDVFGVFIPIPREMFEDFTVPRLQERLNEIRSGLPADEEAAEQQQNQLAIMNRLISIRQAKDDAAQLARGLVDFFNDFTPPALPAPHENQDPNQNVAQAPAEPDAPNAPDDSGLV